MKNKVISNSLSNTIKAEVNEVRHYIALYGLDLEQPDFDIVDLDDDKDDVINKFINDLNKNFKTILTHKINNTMDVLSLKELNVCLLDNVRDIIIEAESIPDEDVARLYNTMLRNVEFQVIYQYAVKAKILHSRIECQPISKFILDKNNVKIAKIKSMYPYLTMINDVSDEQLHIANYVYVFLHELGHISLYTKKINNFHKFDLACNVFHDSLILYEKHSSFLSYHENIYTHTPPELYADQFAYKYFPYVWKKLLGTDIIDSIVLATQDINKPNVN